MVRDIFAGLLFCLPTSLSEGLLHERGIREELIQMGGSDKEAESGSQLKNLSNDKR